MGELLIGSCGGRREEHRGGIRLAAAVAASVVVLLMSAGAASASPDVGNGCRAAMGLAPAGETYYLAGGEYGRTCSYVAGGPGVYEAHAAPPVRWEIYVNGSRLGARVGAGALDTKRGDVVELRAGYNVFHQSLPRVCSPNLARGWSVCTPGAPPALVGSVTAHDLPRP